MRFDGTSFRLQERVDSAGRHIDRVLSLAVGPDSVLWIGTENGLLRYKHNRYRLYTTADGLADNTIPSLHVDRTGALWIGAQRGGITRYAEGQFQTFREIDGVPFDFVNSFVEDGDGTLWVNTAQVRGGLSVVQAPRAPLDLGPLPHVVVSIHVGKHLLRIQLDLDHA